jgi:hypothetical protein
VSLDNGDMCNCIYSDVGSKLVLDKKMTDI